MIDINVLKRRGVISDAQARAIEDALETLMAMDIAMRSETWSDRVDPNEVTKAIIGIIEAFSYTHDDLEIMFQNEGLREIAMNKKKDIQLWSLSETLH